MRRWWIPTLIYVVVALLVGYAVAVGVNGMLALSMAPKELPATPTVPVSVPAVGQAPDILTIRMPVGYQSDPLLRLALRDFRRAVGTPTRVVSTPADFTVREAPSLPDGAYRLTNRGVAGNGRNGLADGLFAAADAIRSGQPMLTGTVAADLEYRFADYGAVGVEPDPQAWAAQDDYSHNSRQFADVMLDHPPWVDPAGMAQVSKEWHQYIDHIRAYGYNGVIVSGFLEYVNFDEVGDGFQVYPADSPYRARHEAMVEQFGQMWKYAADLGMRVVFKTDMLANTGPLNDYVERELGGFDVDDQRLWELYQAGLAEFFQKMPYTDGLMIRIGEAGSVYNMPGWDYYSTLAVTTVDSVRTMLTKFTQTAADYDKTIYFRTWSVGVGAVGDMHTNPESYAKVLDGIPADNLVVVTKFTMGDFYSWLPLNPTLEQGSQPRIVEFQSRREFEAFSSFPNYLSGDHQQALQHFEQVNPNIKGVWVWTQDGGPWRAGPMSLYLKSGFWQLYDLDVYATGRLAWDRNVDLADVNTAWIRRNFTDEPATVRTLQEVFAQSRQVAKEGLYIPPYAEQRVLALGLEPPPMMWIFEWDLVSGDTAALSVIHHASRDRIAEAIERGEAAQADAEAMLRKVQATDPADYKDPALRGKLIHSLQHEVDLFGTLGAFRAAFLSYYDWLDTGSSQAWQQWQADKAAYDAAVAQHLARHPGLRVRRRGRRFRARRAHSVLAARHAGGVAWDPRHRGARPVRSPCGSGFAARCYPAMAAAGDRSEMGVGGCGGAAHRLPGCLLRLVVLELRTGHDRFHGGLHRDGAATGTRTRPLPALRGAGWRVPAQDCVAVTGRCAARTVVLLVPVLDRRDLPHGVRDAERGGVPVAVLGDVCGVARPVRARPAGVVGARVDRGRRSCARARGAHAGLRPGNRAHDVQQPDGAAAAGPVPHPGDHRAPGDSDVDPALPAGTRCRARSGGVAAGRLAAADDSADALTRRRELHGCPSQVIKRETVRLAVHEKGNIATLALSEAATPPGRPQPTHP